MIKHVCPRVDGVHHCSAQGCVAFKLLALLNQALKLLVVINCVKYSSDMSDQLLTQTTPFYSCLKSEILEIRPI